MTKSAPKLTQNPVLSTLIKMAVPMLGGAFAMNAFNLTDTWFVAQLGTLPLAAMSFSFPVVMLLNNIIWGLSTSATAVVSHALGREDKTSARLITTDTLILTALIVICFTIGGLLTIDPIFTMLGADRNILPMIREYMIIWYLGIIFMIFPMMAGDIIRATGDMVSPSVIMVVVSILNMILDPIMIFGMFGFPHMGIRGAALATVIARAISSLLMFWILIKRHDLLALQMPKLKRMFASWKEVLEIGLPSSFTNILIPVSGAVITRIVAGYGETAVAACGAGARVELFAFMIPMTLGVSLVPFVGQNYGANRLDRVLKAQRYSNIFAFSFGIIIAFTFGFFSGNIARLFSDDPAVINILTDYLIIVPLGYGMMEIHRYSGYFLNGLKQPAHAAGVNILRILVLLIPLSLLGGYFFNLTGIFWGRALADIIAGGCGMLWAKNILNKVMNKQKQPAA